MKLNPEMVNRTLNQIDAKAIPEDHPVMPKLKTMFGDHTFFLSISGLSIIEPLKERPQRGTLLNVASWQDIEEGTLIAHDEPESTDVTVELETMH
jgi:SOS-response transcriptional repressor LexA